MYENQSITNCNYKYDKKSKRPSPTNMSADSHARGVMLTSIREIFGIKRISRWVFRGNKMKAGITVEAAIALPLFLFFVLNLGSIIEMIRLHGNLELAITNMGNGLTVYGYVNSMEIPDEEAQLPEEVIRFSKTALSYFMIKEGVEAFLGEEYLDASLLESGSNSLWGTTWQLSPEKDVVQLTLGYILNCPFPVPGFGKVVMLNNYYGHMWTGYAIPGAEDGAVAETVYVTVYGEVFHNRLTCPYLKLTIKQVGLSEMDKLRNKDGEKYVLCEFCSKEKYEGDVYITDWGNCYHLDKKCGGLIRKIYSMTKGEALEEGMRFCSKCKKEEQQ